MNTRPTLDRASFEKVLANAFAVQTSQLDRQSLSAVMEVERRIESGELDLDGTAHLIADYARNVADATGICVGLLKGNQLVFRAGSGSGAVYVGQQVMASLTVSADSNSSGEILRVENAEVDSRIDAAICRQFSAKALLILPIYHDRAVAGVLEILFSEPHAFKDQELRTYRLMAGLVGEVMSHAAKGETAKNVTVELPPPMAPDGPIPSLSGRPLKDAGPIAVQAESAIYQPGETLTRSTRNAPAFGHVRALGTVIIEQAKRVFQSSGRWATTVAPAVLVLIVTCWIAFSARRVPSPSQSSTGPVSVEQQPVLPTRMVQSEAVAKPRTAPVRRQHRRRMGNTEVEYIGDDVTVRHFTSRPPPKRVVVGSNDVHHIGDDVTVRYFTPKPALVQAKQPVVR